MLFLPIPPLPTPAPSDTPPPVFRASTTCPSYFWIAVAGAVGFVVGVYVAKGIK